MIVSDVFHFENDFVLIRSLKPDIFAIPNKNKYTCAVI